MEEQYHSCKICGRPNPDKYKDKFEEYLFWNKEMVIKHIRKEHPEIAKECEG